MKKLLSNVNAYIGLQKALGADRLRYAALEAAGIQPGETVLDIGCGPAYYLDRLPSDITYHGFDTSQPYLEWAGRRFPSASFHHGIFDADAAAGLPEFDVVLMLGLLHHVDDAHAQELMRLCAEKLNPGGRLVTVDTCYSPGQGRISKWISDNDRGEFVRDADGFMALARGSFDKVDGRHLDSMRVPAAMWLMTSTV
ncbi:class I SAM-dependent methyltransferase [Nocardioides humi]|uniref:Methyltransferase domain-containing protein n=1 Tax=Nocardioides humi TaxID=449461 RepID=A0ABN2ANY5_9ACTN|nr:class I SAM-dependent methyltransferase [Nocardioides humi]